MIAEKGAAMIKKQWVTKAEKRMKQTNDNEEKVEEFRREKEGEAGELKQELWHFTKCAVKCEVAIVKYMESMLLAFCISFVRSS